MVQYREPAGPDHKLLPRTQWGINLGTCPVSKGWVIKDVVSGKVTITRDVIFYEEVSYLQWKGVEKEIAAAGTATTSDKVEDLLEEKESEGVGDEKDEEIEDVERADSVDWVWEKAPAREADENKGVEIAGEQPSKEVAEGVNDEVAREERDEESAAEGSSDPWKFLNSGDNQAAEKEIEDLLEEGAIVIGREVKDGEGKALTDSSEEEVESSAEELGKGKRVKKPNPRYAQLLMTCWKDIHTHLLLSATATDLVSNEGKPLLSAGHSAGSKEAARVDSGGAVTMNAEGRNAHREGGGGWAGSAGGTQVGDAHEWPVGGRASKAEVRARLQGRINAILQVRPHRLESVTREINRVVSQLSSQDPTATELSLCNLSLAFYLHLTPLCYPHCLPAITTLDLRRVNPLSPLAMSHLLRLPSLTALHFHETSVHADALPLLQCLPRLHRLVIACFRPFDLLPKNVPAKRQDNRSPLCDPASELQPFEPFESLRELHVSRVTDSLLQQVGVLTSLEALSCTCSKGVSSKGWMHLRGLVKLRRLQVAPTIITQDPGSNDHHFGNPFQGHRFGPKLVGPKLDFSRSRLPEVIRTFRKAPQKGVACVSEELSNRIDGSIWEVVGDLAGLQHLEVHAAQPSTAALRSLSNLTRLTSLHITDTVLHDCDLPYLTRLSLLTHLSLAACAFAADRAVTSVVQGMTQLKALDLSGTAISQGAAVHLRALERLEWLKLQQCSGMSRLLVQHLSRIPSLRQLDLGCNNMQHAWLLPVLEGRKVTRLGVSGCGFVERTVRGIQRAWIEIDSR
ncbi:unnamed protein product [Closterium sp. Yama58-4]|nr:unnamed protein product [Closterium sp. Yama58-4]